MLLYIKQYADKFYIMYLRNMPTEKKQMQEPSVCRIFPFVYLDICADIESVNPYETALKINKKQSTDFSVSLSRREYAFLCRSRNGSLRESPPKQPYRDKHFRILYDDSLKRALRLIRKAVRGQSKKTAAEPSA